MSIQTEPNYNQLLHANLERVFNERDAARRDAAIAELFADNPVMYEPTAIVQGRKNISDVAGNLLAEFGPDFTFVPDGPAIGHHGFAVLSWHAGPKGGPIAVTGADAAKIQGGRIVRLWVLLNTPAWRALPVCVGQTSAAVKRCDMDASSPRRQRISPARGKLLRCPIRRRGIYPRLAKPAAEGDQTCSLSHNRNKITDVCQKSEGSQKRLGGIQLGIGDRTIARDGPEKSCGET